MTKPTAKKRAVKAKVAYRRVVPTFWNDRDINGVLTLEQQAVLLYTFTNEHAHPCGLYRLKPSWVEDELNIPYPTFLELARGPLAPFLTLEEETRELFVHAMAEHQIEGGLHGKDLRITWVEKQVASIESDELRRAFADRYQHWNLSRDRMDVPDVENYPDDGSESSVSVHGRNGARTPKEKGHRNGPSGRGIDKGHTPRPLPKPAAAAATAEGTRTSTATTPSPTPPDPAQPAPGGEGGESHVRVNGAPPEPTRRDLIEAAEPIARLGLNRMRGRSDEAAVVVTLDSGPSEPIGYGACVSRWRDWAAARIEEPAVLARALWHVRDVIEGRIDGPITMALVLAMPALQEQAIHRALDEVPSRTDLPNVVRAMPPASDPEFEAKRARAQVQLAALARNAHPSF